MGCVLNESYSLVDLEVKYSSLKDAEDALDAEISNYVKSTPSINSKVEELHKKLTGIQLLQTDSNQLNKTIAFTSTLAENVSSKVRLLDLFKNHVSLALDRASDLIELEECTEGVQKAIQQENFEQAAAHIHRFLALDRNFLQAGLADHNSSLAQSLRLLYDAEAKLKSLVRNQLDIAFAQGDRPNLERFFKICPLLHMQEEGAKRFSHFIGRKIQDETANMVKEIQILATDETQSRVTFADALSTLFEELARLVETNQPFYETYYGPGCLLVLLRSLQTECDGLVRIVIDDFESERKLKQLLDQVHRSRMGSRSTSLSKADPLRIDCLLSEIAQISSHSELYLRFLRRRLTNDLSSLVLSEAEINERLSHIEAFLCGTDLSLRVQELAGYYIVLEEYYMYESYVKATAMDTLQDNMVSSIVDDTFYIVKKCLQRSLSSGNTDVFCAMLNHASALLESSFVDALKGRQRADYPVSGFDFSSAYGMLQNAGVSTYRRTGNVGVGSDAERARISYLSNINNISASMECLSLLIDFLREEINSCPAHNSPSVHAKIESGLSQLSTVSVGLEKILDMAFGRLQTAAIQPALRPLVESFTSTSHIVGEIEYSQLEVSNPWVEEILTSLQPFVSGFKDRLSSQNFSSFVSRLSVEIVAQLERVVHHMTFNKLGGLLLDRELRALITFLGGLSSWPVREKFTRLTQLASLLSLETEEELLNYWGPNAGSLTWRFTPNEVRHIMYLRTDFSKDTIRNLRL